MARLGRESFERLVARALDELPEEFAARLDNVAVVVEEEPDTEDLRQMGIDPDEGEDLFGLYHGTPLIERDSYYSNIPDRIVIYMGPLTRYCRTPQEIVREVKLTVIHEIGHHFGLSDEEMPY